MVGILFESFDGEWLPVAPAERVMTRQNTR